MMGDRVIRARHKLPNDKWWFSTFHIVMAIFLFVFPTAAVYGLAGYTQIFFEFIQGYWLIAAIVIGWITILRYERAYLSRLNDDIYNKLAEIQTSTKNITFAQERASTYLSNISDRLKSPGYIYVMKRKDGVYKIGKTNDTRRRLTQHINDYGQSFEMIKRFAVPDVDQFERLALRMTAAHAREEDKRQELRTMTNEQMAGFLAIFLAICQQGVDL